MGATSGHRSQQQCCQQYATLEAPSADHRVCVRVPTCALASACPPAGYVAQVQPQNKSPTGVNTSAKELEGLSARRKEGVASLTARALAPPTLLAPALSTSPTLLPDMTFANLSCSQSSLVNARVETRPQVRVGHRRPLLLSLLSSRVRARQ